MRINGVFRGLDLTDLPRSMIDAVRPSVIDGSGCLTCLFTDDMRTNMYDKVSTCRYRNLSCSEAWTT